MKVLTLGLQVALTLKLTQNIAKHCGGHLQAQDLHPNPAVSLNV